jgi:predicted  nucleic acid-binding Zn-ribbon protein
MDEKELMALKKKIDKSKERKAGFEQRYADLMEEMHQWGYKTVEELQQAINKLHGELDELNEELDEKLGELDEKYQDIPTE